MVPKALLLAANGVRDCHLLSAYHVLVPGGVELDVAGPRVGLVVGEHGYAVAATTSFPEIEPERYDLLIVPGLNGHEHICLDKAVARLVAHFILSGKAVAPFCRQGRVGLHVLGLDPKRPADTPAAQLTGRTWRCPDELPASCRLIFHVLRGRCGCSARTVGAQVTGMAQDLPAQHVRRPPGPMASLSARGAAIAHRHPQRRHASVRDGAEGRGDDD